MTRMRRWNRGGKGNGSAWASSLCCRSIRNGSPIVVTHPSPLLYNGLRQLLRRSHFRPVGIATILTDDLETYLNLARKRFVANGH